MFRYYVLLFISLLLSLCIQAQQAPDTAKANLVFSGRVIDSVSAQPIAFATVYVLNANQQPPAYAGITNEAGQFYFTLTSGIKNSFHLGVHAVGYYAKSTAPVWADSIHNVFHFRDIPLKPATTLKTVEVSAQRPLIETKIDRLIYNAELDITSQGGNATDVLRKVPMLSVDINGNPSLRGSSNFKVLLNGKTSGMFSANLADALKSLPADMIKSVEVITSPSARYDAEGSAGIINIILKKNSSNGTLASLNLSGGHSFVGTYNGNGGASLYIKSNRWSINSNLNGSIFKTFNLNSLTRDNFSADSVFRLTQEGKYNYKGRNLSGLLEIEYELDKHSVLGASVYINPSLSTTAGNVAATSGSFPADHNNPFIKDINNRSSRPGMDASLSYGKKFNRDKQALDVIFQYYSKTNNYSYHTRQLTTPGDAVFYGEEGINRSLQREYTFQADYTHPFNKALLWNAGAKSITRQLSSRTSANLLNTFTGKYEEDITRAASNQFNQDIQSLYTLFTLEAGKGYSVQAGIRMENTRYKANFDTAFANTYLTVIPSLILSKQFKNNRLLKWSFTQRIQRPGINHLNPFVDKTDPQTIRYGNPAIAPEKTSLYELSYNFYMQKRFVNISAFYRYTNNSIERIWRPQNDSINASTYENIGNSSNAGCNIYSTGPFFYDKLTVTPSVNIYHIQMRSPEYRNSRWVYSLGLSATVLLKNNFSIEAYGNYNARAIQLQGSTSSLSYTMLGVKKKMLENRLTATLSLMYPFKDYVPSWVESQGYGFSQRSDMLFPMRQLRLSINYQLGKMNFNKKSRTATIKNEDIKKEEG